jgi:hypothetical protein
MMTTARWRFIRPMAGLVGFPRREPAQAVRRGGLADYRNRRHRAVFRLKVSADGVSWNNAMAVDMTANAVRRPIVGANLRHYRRYDSLEQRE